MNVLGLHFGHDAAVAVLRDGAVASYLLRERRNRVKHAMTLDGQTIRAALDEAGVRVGQIQACAITSTQSIELVIDDPRAFSLVLEPHPGHRSIGTMGPLLREQGVDPRSLLVGSLMSVLGPGEAARARTRTFFERTFPEAAHRDSVGFGVCGWLDQYVEPELWKPRTLEALEGADFTQLLDEDTVRLGQHLPVTAVIEGHSLPAYLVSHHASHAASSYYQSGLRKAAILTHDGYAHGDGCLTGMCWLGRDERIYPLTPHHLFLGALYDTTSFDLGLGINAAGKLMGLAAYGRPAFFDPLFVGNWFDWIERGLGPDAWWQHCLAKAGELGYDVAALADAGRLTAPINADIAASTQLLLEETFLAAAKVLKRILARVGEDTQNLCVSGGTALNCPSNSRLYREGPFANVFVEPGCDDSGVAIGAASFVYHNVLGTRRTDTRRGSAYLGPRIGPDTFEQALQAVSGGVRAVECADPPRVAAEALVRGEIIGWFEGRSEIGPRALGHRSILADPRNAGNWPRVNVLKGREWWRPFAPAVLEAEADRWFDGAPQPSPYMLFTARVLSERLPAVTHVDGTARLQTVGEEAGAIFELIVHFFDMTGVPVVLNTSFNGPGEPIVESPSDALRFLLSSSLDALFMGGYRITRR